MTRQAHTPEWVHHAVFYQIFPDRFAKSNRVPKASNLEPWDSPPTVHGYKGGDLLGVVEHLDYLQDLGVTALYFNPVFQSASNHRYHTHDYFQVDPMLGGNAALRELIDALHARDMRIILDGVFNHSSRGFFQFNDILENGRSSAYLDWFHVRKFPLNAYGEGTLGYDAWWGLPALPKFNTSTQAVREFLWRVGEFWLEFGIDGWRLDVPNEIDDDVFWRTFRQRCLAVNDECYIVGEIWEDASRWLQGDQFDAVMNYPFTRAVFGLVADALNEKEIARSGYKHIEKLEVPVFATEVERLLTGYDPAIVAAQFNLLGSHDTPRIMRALSLDEAAVRMAFFLLLTFPGAPCVYYGDEIGLAGGHDPDCREGMPWDEASWNKPLRRFIQTLIQYRKNHTALRTGTYRVLYAAEDTFAFLRTDTNQQFIGVLNLSKEQRPLRVPLEDKLEGEFRDVLNGLGASARGGVLRGHELPARSVALFMLE